jgi:glycosyltransferase involved in cell wall biosynthesis
VLTVVIPCRSEPELLAEQLDALSRQDAGGVWEVVVADNGSGGALGPVVDRFSAHVPGLRLVDASDRPGAAHARNVGAAAGHGEWIAFIDADDVADTGWVRGMQCALARSRFVASRWDATELNPPDVRASRSVGQEHGVQTYRYPTFLPHAGGCGLGVHRSVHDGVGGFDEELGLLEDTDYCWRIQLSGVPLDFAEEALIHIRLRQTRAGAFRQAYGYGRYNVLLYKRYLGQGMPRLRPRDGLVRLARLLLRFGQLFSRRRRAYLFSLGFRLGRISGSLRYHVWGL